MSPRIGGALIGLMGVAVGLLVGLGTAAVLESAPVDAKDAHPAAEAWNDVGALLIELSAARDEISRLAGRNADLEAELAEALNPLNADIITLVKSSTALVAQFEREKKEFNQERERFESETKLLRSRLTAEQQRTKTSQEFGGSLLDRCEKLSKLLDRANERLDKAGLPIEK